MKIFFIVIVVLSIIGLLTSIILQNNYRHTLYSLNNITLEDQITYNLVKSQYPSKTLYFVKLNHITEAQYSTFIKVLIVEQEISNSLYDLIWLLSAMLGVFSIVMLICLTFIE